MQQERGPGICISNKGLGDADAAGPETTLKTTAYWLYNGKRKRREKQLR